MNNHEFSKIVLSRQASCRSLLSVKADEYAGEDDRLENFQRAAALQGSRPEQAVMGMLAKHLVSIAMMIEQIKVGIDYGATWEEKISDAINYLHLLEAVLVDNYGESAVKQSFIDEVD